MSKPSVEQTLALILKKIEKIEKAIAPPKANRAVVRKAMNKTIQNLDKKFA